MSLQPLKARAQGLGHALPPLLAQAEALAAHVQLGEHGRRRAGSGNEFWQYRQAVAGDEARFLDWRRSARSDHHYIREREWQAAQAVTLWVDSGQSMGFSGEKSLESKGDRAKVLALALAILLLRGGEKVALLGQRAKVGKAQLLPLAASLLHESSKDYATPDPALLPDHGMLAFFSDFLGPMEEMESAMAAASAKGLKGVLCQVLDPSEESFPYEGRVIFQSMSGALRHETHQAQGLRAAYLQRLAQRKSYLSDLSRKTGWHYQCFHTGEGAQAALLWLYHAIGGGR